VVGSIAGSAKFYGGNAWCLVLETNDAVNPLLFGL